MAKSEVFFFDQGGPLWMDRIKEKDGIITGEVINGAWNFWYDGSTVKAKNGGYVVTTTENVTITHRVPVTKEWSGRDCNEVINKAREMING